MGRGGRGAATGAELTPRGSRLLTSLGPGERPDRCRDRGLGTRFQSTGHGGPPAPPAVPGPRGEGGTRTERPGAEAARGHTRRPHWAAVMLSRSTGLRTLLEGKRTEYTEYKARLSKCSNTVFKVLKDREVGPKCTDNDDQICE